MQSDVPGDPEQLHAAAAEEFEGLAQRRSRILEEQLDRVVRWDWYTDFAHHPLPLHFQRDEYGFPLGRLMKNEPEQKSNRVLYGFDMTERPVIEQSYLKPSELGYHEEAWVYSSDRLYLYGFHNRDGAPERATVAWLSDGLVTADAWRGKHGDGVRLYEYDEYKLLRTVRQLFAQSGDRLAPHSTFVAEYDDRVVVRVTQYNDQPGTQTESGVVFPSRRRR